MPEETTNPEQVETKPEVKVTKKPDKFVRGAVLVATGIFLFGAGAVSEAAVSHAHQSSHRIVVEQRFNGGTFKGGFGTRPARPNAAQGSTQSGSTSQSGSTPGGSQSGGARMRGSAPGSDGSQTPTSDGNIVAPSPSSSVGSGQGGSN